MKVAYFCLSLYLSYIAAFDVIFADEVFGPFCFQVNDRTVCL